MSKDTPMKLIKKLQDAFGGILKTFQPDSVQPDMFESAIVSLKNINAENAHYVYTPDFTTKEITVYYTDIKSYIASLSYLINCFEQLKLPQISVVAGKTSIVFVNQFFENKGNYLPDTTETFKEFRDLAITFLMIYKEARHINDNPRTERIVYIAHAVALDLYNLASQLENILSD